MTNGVAPAKPAKKRDQSGYSDKQRDEADNSWMTI
jgi:hypothetical protein